MTHTAKDSGDGNITEAMHAITQALEDLWDSGCPVPAPGNRQRLAAIGLRRWRSIEGRHRKPQRLTHADRIRDLAGGLIEVCEPEPALVGPPARDYECVAEASAHALGAAPQSDAAASHHGSSAGESAPAQPHAAAFPPYSNGDTP